MMTFFMKASLGAPLASLAGFPALASAANTARDPGKAYFIQRQDGDFDQFTNNPSASQQQWMRDHFFRAMQYSNYFDSKTSWFPNALNYVDSYGMGTPMPSDADPAWVLKDSSGQRLWVKYNCDTGNHPGQCDQYAGDIGNPAFRNWKINYIKSRINLGYKGVWFDDLNMSVDYVSDGYGNSSNHRPIDPRTGLAIDDAKWRQYFAEYTEALRAALPNIDILHNPVWYTNADTDSQIKREIQAADFINIERGVLDGGLSGGTGFWSYFRVLSYVDMVHSYGRGVVFDGVDKGTNNAGREYNLASYFLVSNGMDAIGDQSMYPNNWWAGYDVSLGAPSGARTAWNNLYRRDFAGGMVLVNGPGGGNVTVTLPGTYKRIDGSSVGSITLGEKQGAVLMSNSTPPPPPPRPSCDVNGDGKWTVQDVQTAINQVVGLSACASDINQDGACTVADVQRIVNAVLNGTCVTGP